MTTPPPPRLVPDRPSYSDDDLTVIVQDWDESDPDQAVAINLARELLQRRAKVAAPPAEAPGECGHLREVIGYIAEDWIANGGEVLQAAAIRLRAAMLASDRLAAAPAGEAVAKVELNGFSMSGLVYTEHGRQANLKDGTLLYAAPAAPAEGWWASRTLAERLAERIRMLRVEGGLPSNGLTFGQEAAAAKCRELADLLERDIADTAPRVTGGREELRGVLSDLLDHVDDETCTHEETHRGGAIWTICDNCGQKWADDEGGFVPHEDAPAVAKARAALQSATGEVG